MLLHATNGIALLVLISRNIWKSLTGKLYQNESHVQLSDNVIQAPMIGLGVKN